jgi:hypothetical protein
MEDTLLTEEATDERWPPKLKNEVLRGLRLPPAALWKETVEIGRDAGNFGEGGARVLAAAENGRVIVPLPMW